VKRLILAALLLAAFPAIAQTPRTATISFVRPAEYVDGTPIASTVAVSYKVFQGARGATKTLVGTITATDTTITSGLQPGETCWQVSVVANGVESALSNEACKAFEFPATEAVTITVI
jgi:hypothetical protein